MKRIDRIEDLDRALGGGPVSPSVRALVDVAAEVRAALSMSVPEQVAAAHLRGLRGPVRRSRVLQALLAAAIVMTLTLGGAVGASASALPGEALYPVKRAVEAVNLAIEADHADRAALHLTYAERRLEELSRLLEMRRNGEDVNVGAAMKAYREQVAGAEADLAAAEGNEDQLARIEARLAAHVSRLSELAAGKKNPRATEAIEQAIDNARRAAERLAERHANKPGKGKPADAGGERGRSSQAPGRR